MDAAGEEGCHLKEMGGLGVHREMCRGFDRVHIDVLGRNRIFEADTVYKGMKGSLVTVP